MYLNRYIYTITLLILYLKKFIAESGILNDKQNNWGGKLHPFANHY